MFNTELTPKQIYNILISIIGEVDPVADSAIDRKRLGNLQMLEFVADFIIEKILKISKEYNSPYGSVKTMAEEACDWVEFWRNEFTKRE